MSLVENSQKLLSQVVYDYIKFYFTPAKMKGAESLQYMYENALHLNLGRNVDHFSYVAYLANQYPYVGIIVKDKYTLLALRKTSVKKYDATYLPRNISNRFEFLPKPVELLVIYEATKFSPRKLGRVLINWTTEKPLILLG
jgi:hypothetical protein